MCQYRFIDYDKCTIVKKDVNIKEIYVRGIRELSVEYL